MSCTRMRIAQLGCTAVTVALRDAAVAARVGHLADALAGAHRVEQLAASA